MMVGVLGAGQLGRMLALAGVPLGLRFRFLDHTPNAPASHVGDQVVGEFEDVAALDRFAHGLDVCTLEFENVPVTAVHRVGARVPVFPPAEALATAQDRGLEKACFTQLGIPTTRYELAQGSAGIERAVQAVGTPCVVKTRRLGYDGKGQWVVRGPADVGAATLGAGDAPVIVEEFIPFDRELSIIGVRARPGDCVFYPLSQNHHRGGILRSSIAPAPGAESELQRRAEAYAARVLDRFGYVGALAIEFFDRAGELIANEMAPRVHNSGHWTIEGASCSQFENHVRAVCGLPLAKPECLSSAMLNLIGTHPPLDRLLRVPGARVHLYGKQPREGRKLGHVTLVGATQAQLQPAVAELQRLISETSPSMH